MKRSRSGSAETGTLRLASWKVRSLLRQSVRQRSYLQGQEPLDIDSLISPLRYDVLVREQFLRFHGANLDLFANDFEAYFTEALGHPYFVWYREVVYPRLFGRPPRDQSHLVAGYRDRVCKSIRLYHTFQRDGFDPRFPISVRQGRQLETTSTGKVLAGRFYPVDGCHRLAILRLNGWASLPPECYRIRHTQLPLIDNTFTLLPALDVEAKDYYAFLSLGYGTETFHEREALLQYLEANDPARLGEVEGIIAVDTPRLRPVDTPQPRIA